MALTSCPECGLPRTAEDIASAACPVCGFERGTGRPTEGPSPEPAAPILLTPVAAEEPSPARNWLLLAGVVAVGGLVVAAMLIDWKPRSTPTQSGPVVPSVAGPPARPEIAPPPRVVPPPPPRPPELAPYPRPAPTRIAIEQPNEEYRLERLTAGQQVRLIGTAKRLVVAGLDSGAALDASELTVEDVVFLGPIRSGAAVTVKTPGGVVFRDAIEGPAQVAVEALFVGFVTSTSKKGPGSRIIGGAQVKLTARGVFLDVVGGEGTRVDVTLLAPGSIRFAAVSDSARLLYRTERPNDPPPRVSRGDVHGNAIVQRER